MKKVPFMSFFNDEYDLDEYDLIGETKYCKVYGYPYDDNNDNICRIDVLSVGDDEVEDVYTITANEVKILYDYFLEHGAYKEEYK